MKACSPKKTRTADELDPKSHKVSLLNESCASENLNKVIFKMERFSFDSFVRTCTLIEYYSKIELKPRL